jgi:hypothetical protein
MPPATGAKYTRRETTGRIQEANDDGLKINGVWWNNSRQKPLDLGAYRLGDSVYVCADETHDGGRRFIVDIEPVQTARPEPKPGEYSKPAAGPAFVDALPDKWEDGTHRTFTAAQIASHRLEALRIAASVIVPGWTKKNVEPDTAVLFGVADELLDWLYRSDDA